MTQNEWNNITSQQIDSLQRQIERLNGAIRTLITFNESQERTNELLSSGVKNFNGILERITELKKLI